MRRIFGVAALCLMAATGPLLAANPYAAAITVNNGVITNYDIDQRMKLLEALGANGDLRPLAVQQLTEDRVKQQAAEDMDIELPEGAVEQGVDEFATGRGTDPRRRGAGPRGARDRSPDDERLRRVRAPLARGRRPALPRPRPPDRGRHRRRPRAAPDPAAGDAHPRRDRAALRGARRGRDPGPRRRPLPAALPRCELRRRRLGVQPQRLGRTGRRPQRRCRPTACRRPSAPRSFC